MSVDSHGDLYVTWGGVTGLSTVDRYAHGMGVPATIAKGYLLG